MRRGELATDAERVKTIAGSYDVYETVARLRDSLSEKGLNIFAHIDHAASDSDMGLEMQPAQVLAWGDRRESVWVNFPDAAYVAGPLGLPADLAGNILSVEAVITAAVTGGCESH